MLADAVEEVLLAQFVRYDFVQFPLKFFPVLACRGASLRMGSIRGELAPAIARQHAIDRR